MKRELLKEAIADAKTMKESAIANAKVALEEAFSPQLHAMFASKIEEMEVEEEDEEIEKIDEVEDEVDIEEDDMSLDEMLAEFEKNLDDSSSKEPLKEESDEDAELEGDLDDEEVEVSDIEDMDDEEIDLEEMSEDDLKDFIESVIADMVNTGELEAGEEFEIEDEDEVEDEVEVEDGEEIEVEDEVEVTIDEGLLDFLKTKKDEAPKPKASDRKNTAIGVDYDGNYINADGEIIRENGSENQEEEYVGDDEKYEYEKGIEAEKNALQEDLSRVMETVSTLRSELKDINLLNAKLLYTNKIFKTNNMTEAQKVKVLGAFDKTSTISEVKVVYNTISENVTFNKKSMNEGVRGSASKITITPKKVKKPIMEETEMVNRFKKLAGII
tara:strand:- start:799 stop:1953 length:1155 start_codon:yes stop_codon:yes gene_type:complete